MGTHPIFESDFDCLTEMLIRYLHVGRNLSAIEASSPFDKIFFDFQKSSLRTSGYNLFVKEYQPKTKNSSQGNFMKEVNKIWKSTPQATKDKFNGRAQLEKERVIGNLVHQYVSEQQYNAIYDGNFSKVNSGLSKLYNECLDIKVKENRDFFLAVKKMYDLKRDSVTNFKAKWCKVNRTNNTQFQKLSVTEKNKIKTQYLSEYRMFLDQMMAAFPEHEIPSFLMVEIDENSEKYKHDIRIYRKISKEIKNFKSEEKQNKELKMRVKEELKMAQIALRSKMGFTAGSEKRPLTPYLMYSRDLREQAKKTTSPKLTAVEIGKKWKSLNAKQKSVWEKKSMTEVNKAKIMNKGAVQRTIQAPIEDCIALTMDEAKANLNNEQLGFYKKILTQKRKEIKEKIEKEMNLVKN